MIPASSLTENAVDEFCFDLMRFFRITSGRRMRLERRDRDPIGLAEALDDLRSDTNNSPGSVPGSGSQNPASHVLLASNMSTTVRGIGPLLEEATS